MHGDWWLERMSCESLIRNVCCNLPCGLGLHDSLCTLFTIGIWKGISFSGVLLRNWRHCPMTGGFKPASYVQCIFFVSFLSSLWHYCAQQHRNRDTYTCLFFIWFHVKLYIWRRNACRIVHTLYLFFQCIPLSFRLKCVCFHGAAMPRARSHTRSRSPSPDDYPSHFEQIRRWRLHGNLRIYYWIYMTWVDVAGRRHQHNQFFHTDMQTQLEVYNAAQRLLRTEPRTTQFVKTHI